MMSLGDLKAWYVKALNLPVADPDTVDENAPLELDSVDIVLLADAVERDFGLEIESLSQTRGAFDSLRKLSDYLESRGQYEISHTPRS